MHAQAIAIALAPTTAEAPLNPDPMQAYRAYLGAIARRDFGAVVARMTEGCARQLFGSRDTPDFLALFELWCDSQCDPVVIIRYAVEHDLALIDVRSLRTTGRVTLRLGDGGWRIASEVHKPVHDAVARGDGIPSKL